MPGTAWSTLAQFLPGCLSYRRIRNSERRTRVTPATPPTGPRDAETGLLAGRKPFTLRIIPGGKIGSKRPARQSNH